MAIADAVSNYDAAWVENLGVRNLESRCSHNLPPRLPRAEISFLIHESLFACC